MIDSVVALLHPRYPIVFILEIEFSVCNLISQSFFLFLFLDHYEYANYTTILTPQVNCPLFFCQLFEANELFGQIFGQGQRKRFRLSKVNIPLW